MIVISFYCRPLATQYILPAGVRQGLLDHAGRVFQREVAGRAPRLLSLPQPQPRARPPRPARAHRGQVQHDGRQREHPAQALDPGPRDHGPHELRDPQDPLQTRGWVGSRIIAFLLSLHYYLVNDNTRCYVARCVDRL